MMRYIITGFAILLGLILFFMFITACAPARSMTRDTYRESRVESNNTGSSDRDYSYDERDDAADEDGAGTARHVRTSRKAIAPAVRSGGADRPANEDIAVDDGDNEIEETDSPQRFYQKGEASWYGRAFHGKLTASGERFDMNRLTAAHKTLPFGTVLEVKNLENDKTVRVKVNDRGPYRGGRIIDLSYAAARRLDMLGAGRSNVGITIVKKGTGERTASKAQPRDDIEPVAGIEDDASGSDDLAGDSESGRMALQAGAFYSRNNADQLKRKIEGMTRRPVSIIRDGDLYKVRVNALSSRREAQRVRDRLNQEDIPSFIVREGRE